MNQAMNNMAPLLSEKNRFELIATITSLLWLFGGLFSDGILLLSSMFVTIILMIYLIIYSLIPSTNFVYNVNTSSFRKLVIGGFSHWSYTTGSSKGLNEISFEGFTIPVLVISQLVLATLAFLWFSTKYTDQFRDPNTPKQIYPFLLLRGLLRGSIIVAFIFAIISPDPLPGFIQFPYLFGIYLVEPFVYGILQQMNSTVSRLELTLGNARLPSIALRESFLSNTFLLIFTMIFNGVDGLLWQFLRVYYLLGLIIIFIYSFDAIDKFKEHPLGKQAIGNYLQNTPQILRNMDLEQSFGHVIENDVLLDLSDNSSVNIESGSIVVPLEETRGKVNALVIGKGQSIVKSGDKRIGEIIEGVSSVLIPAGEFKTISKNYMSTKLSSIDLENLKLPSLDELSQYVSLLSTNMGSFVGKLINQISSIDLSGYGITESKGRTEVNLPGIYVNETPGLTTVRVAGIKVYDAEKGTTVRIGNTLTVVDLPKASFVSLPGIDVVEISGVGQAVNLLGFQISDGIPAGRLKEIRELIMQQLDRWELGIDAELGRYLADKSASGLLNVGWDGEFNLLLDSKRKTLGTHEALTSGHTDSKHMHYLPPDFDEQMREQSKEDIEFIELTGFDPTKQVGKLEKKTTQPELQSTDSIETNTDEFSTIYDVEIEEVDEEES